MTIGEKAKQLERKLARTVNAAVGELIGRDEPSPLEIVHAVLDRAEHEVQEVGRGRRVFPYTGVRLVVAVPPRDRQARARVEAVVAGPPSLAERLAERLRGAGCDASGIAADLQFARQAASDWEDPRFHVVFERGESASARSSTMGQAPPRDAPSPGTPKLKLSVLKGATEQRGYVFTGGRIDIGRRAEVVDQRQRLVRTNQVAFLDDEAADNRSVSRRHAHVEFVESEGGYRIWDDRSAHGTSVVRGGRTVKVPPGARGMRLVSGDEIALGQARLKVSIG